MGITARRRILGRPCLPRLPAFGRRPASNRCRKADAVPAGRDARSRERSSLDEVIAAIGGEDNIILINYDQQMLADHESFIARWGKAFAM